MKWGGDAALLLFDGSAHAARACRAAIAMQRTMRRIGGLRTSSGPVRLQMSIGVHSGRIDFYLVGSAHRELVVAGESATLTAVMEQVAGPAQTVLSAATVAALGPSGTGLVEEIGPETGYYLLRRAPAVAPRPNRATKRVRGLDLGRALPTAIREHVAAGPVEGEHRHLAIAFVEFAGTDELTARFGADTVAETLDELMRVVQAETERNGVTLFTTDINRNGGKLLLVAGAPRATGDDETNLLAAVRAILAVDSPLRLRAGANSGRAYVGDFGPSYRRTYSIVGDSVNLAARVMSKADVGELLATEAVLERARVAYAATPLPPFAVKGKTQLVQAFAVGEPDAARAPEARHALPFVGRDRELATLMESLDSARAGNGRFVELIGPPGIGKSRLVAELVARAGDARVVQTAGDTYSSSTPYRAFARMLAGVVDARDATDRAAVAREVVARVAKLAPEMAPWLPLVGAVFDVELPSTPEVDA
ncbi:MAG: AAA family ATPase, partial [Frankia sp.]|nr:AAA family ATPase [Frankia sp.]